MYGQHQQCMRYLVQFSLPEDEEAEKEEREDRGDAEGAADEEDDEEEAPSNDGGPIFQGEFFFFKRAKFIL